MKKIFFSIALAVSMMASAQIVEVASISRVDVPANTENKVAAFSPDGKYILLTNTSNAGLKRFDLATSKVSTISSAQGAGYNVRIAKDSKSVVYRETSLDENQMRLNTIMCQEFGSPSRKVMARGQRNLSAMVADNDVPSFSIKDQQLMITENGQTRTFSPNGQQYSYIWPTLSPDGKKVAYYVCAVGCFVCNIDGSNVRFISHNCLAPQWLGNETLIGMDEKDNGEIVTSSAIVAFNLKGQSQVLTDNSMIAVYPYVSNNQVAFSTAAGEVYIMNLK